VTPQIVSVGSRRGPLVLAFHVGGDVLSSALVGAGMGDATAAVIVSRDYNALPDWHALLSTVAERAGWQGGPVCLVGWSAGAGAVRSLLAAGARPEVTVMLDGGVGGDMPPSPAVVETWRAAAERARGGDGLLVLSHIYQTYTEGLPGASAYPSTVRVVRLATGLPLDPPAPRESPREVRDRGLVVLSWASGVIDGKAHSEQQTRALPLVLNRYVAPHLAGQRRPERGTGAALLDVALSMLGEGETPAGSNAGPFVARCFAGAMRGGVRVGIKTGAWCAAFVGLCDSLSGVPRTWRCSVAELVADARAVGAFRSVDEYQPEPGDLAVYGRGGQDPRTGGTGHVGIYRGRLPGGEYDSIEGNHLPVVAVVPRRFDAPELLGWIVTPRTGVGRG
jgi:hypothetical protein